MAVSKNIKKFLSDEKLIDEILSQSESMDEVYKRLGYILSYQIASGSSNPPKIKGKYPGDLHNEPEIQKLSKEEIRNNINVVTHSFNGYNFKKVKKHGLGSDKIIDEELNNDMDELGAILGVTEHPEASSNETFYSAPGAKTFHYACGYSPEKLWMGILKQDRIDALPIKVGETKKDYAMRVLKSKVDSLGPEYSEEQRREIFKKGERVIEKLCTKKPVVALIPTNSKKFSLTAHQNGQGKEEQSPKLNDILEEGTGLYSKDDPISFFTEETDWIEPNNLGNLSHVGHIPSSELDFFEVEDSFSLMQRRAKLMGLEDGDEIDYFTGNRYEPPKPEINPVSKEEIEGVKDPEIVSKDDIYISPDKKRQQVKGVVDEDDMDM